MVLKSNFLVKNTVPGGKIGHGRGLRWEGEATGHLHFLGFELGLQLLRDRAVLPIFTKLEWSTPLLR